MCICNLSVFRFNNLISGGMVRNSCDLLDNVVFEK